MFSDKTKYNTFQKLALTTVGATIFLIFIGGLVRAAGAGLGCPDWPKCFGMWIPPTSISELPDQFIISQFNVFKTWTEYVNRLVEVIVVLLATTTFLLSFRHRKTNPAVTYSSGAAFLIVLVQGLLAGQIVMIGLDEWLITLQMMLVMIVMMTFIYATFKASPEPLSIQFSKQVGDWMLWAVLILMASTFIQLILGTQVREMVDMFENLREQPPREMWISRVGLIDEVHRSFSWIILIAGGVIFYLSRWQIESPVVKKVGTTVFGLILLQLLTGLGLYYLGLPPVYQLIHLAGVAFLIAFEFLLFLIVMQATA